MGQERACLPPGWHAPPFKNWITPDPVLERGDTMKRILIASLASLMLACGAGTDTDPVKEDSSSIKAKCETPLKGKWIAYASVTDQSPSCGLPTDASLGETDFDEPDETGQHCIRTYREDCEKFSITCTEGTQKVVAEYTLNHDATDPHRALTGVITFVDSASGACPYYEISGNWAKE